MTLEITTPTGVTGLVTVNSYVERAYFDKWIGRGYNVKEIVNEGYKSPSINGIRMHIGDSVCTACEG
jgi:hypothetical protein